VGGSNVPIEQIQDGGRRHFEKSINRHNSATVCPVITKSGKKNILALFTPWAVRRYNIMNFHKSKLADNRHQECRNIAASQQ